MIQSVVFKKQYWNVPRAKKWLDDHKLKHTKVDITDSQLRFRQTDPRKFKRFYTKKATPSINLIIGN